MESRLAFQALLGGLLDFSTVFNYANIILINIRISALYASFEIVILATLDYAVLLVFRVSDERIVA